MRFAVVALCLLVGWVAWIEAPTSAQAPLTRTVRWDRIEGATFYRLYQEQCKNYWFWKNCSWVRVGENLIPEFTVAPPAGQSRWMAANVFSSDREVRNTHFGWWLEY